MPTTISRRPPRAARLPQLLLRLSSAVCALLLVWAVGELFMRVLVSRTRIYGIEMVRYAKLLKMEDPEGIIGHVHRPNSSAELMGVKVALNSLGHRGPELGPKTADEKRILVVGNSITLGWGVPEEETFSAVSEAALNRAKPFGPGIRFQFVNSGVGNYDTLAELNLFKRQYALVRPDAVVLQYFINDAEPRTKGNDGFILKHSYLADMFYDRARLVRMKWKGEALTDYYAALYAGDDGAWAKTRGYIQEMRGIAKDHGIPFVVMIVPDVHNLLPGTPYAAIYAKIERELGALGIPTLNAFGPFQDGFSANESALWIQADDPHPNAKGHALMAELFDDYFVRENPLKLPRPRAR